MSARTLGLVALLCAGCGVEEISPDPIAAPFAVSDYFVPSGFMGDGSLTEHEPEPLVMSRAENCAPRPAGARGICYRFTYTPVSFTEGGVGWAGAYWQSPANNWGQDPPQKVKPNAARVAFYAAGATGGENVIFLVGGLNATDPDGAPLPYGDTFKLSKGITLTTEMAQYEVPFTPDATYDAVVGGFGFSISAAGSAAQTIYLDDIVWLP